MSARPLIAIPAMSSAKVQGLRFAGSVAANAVISAVARAGGDPVIVSPLAELSSWNRFDGIVLPGGSDIDPQRYGRDSGTHDQRTDFVGQDDADARAIAIAEDTGIPALFICRGMQLWNVERGGTLVQHLDAADDHVGAVHDVDVVSESRLAQIAGGTVRVDVSSYHHQAVDQLGQGLRVVARAGDGTVEAIEDPARNIVAVQWHPEDRADGTTAGAELDRRLFDWIVEAAGGRG